MFFPILLIAIGLAILLNTMGVFSGSFWGFFWGIIFILFGFRMMMRKEEKCPICSGFWWKEKMNSKMHGDGDCCGHHHDEKE